jgi:hypothetical protein
MELRGHEHVVECAEFAPVIAYAAIRTLAGLTVRRSSDPTCRYEIIDQIHACMRRLRVVTNARRARVLSSLLDQETSPFGYGMRLLDSVSRYL